MGIIQTSLPHAPTKTKGNSKIENGTGWRNWGVARGSSQGMMLLLLSLPSPERKMQDNDVSDIWKLGEIEHRLFVYFGSVYCYRSYILLQDPIGSFSFVSPKDECTKEAWTWGCACVRSALELVCICLKRWRTVKIDCAVTHAIRT